MDLHKRQQFEFLLQTAVERLGERLEQKFRGADVALQQMQAGNTGDYISEFVDAFFADFLLDNIEGACFILQGLAKKRMNQFSFSTEQTLEVTLVQLAKLQYTKLLSAKTLEALEQHSGYQPVDTGADQ
ncbi:MAG: hypothetical protein U0930_02425 [Pirellulales bacterium]